ncbi:MAG: hypothetical protein QOF44_2520, partial [Streptomyces sp.]|nr:hypothetical protein [Streptomyces sp.]
MQIRDPVRVVEGALRIDVGRSV